jgi:hypothetical protein
MTKIPPEEYIWAADLIIPNEIQVVPMARARVNKKISAIIAIATHELLLINGANAAVPPVTRRV